MRRNKEELPTVKKLRQYRRLSAGLKVGSYGACLVPFGIELGVNWNSWFGADAQSNVSLGVGFSMLVLATLASMVAVMKKDEDFMKKFSPLFYITLVVALFGAAFLFLGSIMSQMGMMFVYTAIGIAGGAITDEVNRDYAKPMIAKYDALVKKYGLTDKAEKELLIEAQAKKDAEERRKTHPID